FALTQFRTEGYGEVAEPNRCTVFLELLGSPETQYAAENRRPDGPCLHRVERRRHLFRAVAGSATARPQALALHARPAVDARRQGVRARRGNAGARRQGRPLLA